MLIEQLNRIKTLSGIQEGTKSLPTIFYRGTGGSNEFNGNSHDQDGPGIYFSSSPEDARMYGENIWKVEFKGKAVPNKKFPKLAQQLTWLIKQSDNWEEDAQNWHENPAKGLQIAVNAAIQYNDTAPECFQQIWIDFYRDDAKEFIRNLASIYDASFYEKDNGIYHMVVYNPASLITLNKIVDDGSDNIMYEGLNLNLSKQIRRYQKRQPVDKQLEEYFGKNVYRLYYDLDTGKQITPTRKDPKLKIDIKADDTLKAQVKARLEGFGFAIEDFDKNVAKNTNNGQSIKISKVLAKYDSGLHKQYNTFLDAMTKYVSGKFYAVISRHSSDMAMMGTHENFQSCENLGDITDIKNTFIRNNMYGENPAGDGNGERAGEMIRDGSLIFYMIKEGDWDIQKPLSRFASGVYCENHMIIYGDFSPKFKSFIQKWIYQYELNVLKSAGLVAHEELFSKPVEELGKLLNNSLLHNRAVNKLPKNEFIRGIIDNNRFDVIEFAINNAHTDYKDRIFIDLFDVFVEDMSTQVVKTFPDSLRGIIDAFVDEETTKVEDFCKVRYNVVSEFLKTPDKFFEKFKDHQMVIDMILKSHEYVFFDTWLGLDGDFIAENYNGGVGSSLMRMAKLLQPKKYATTMNLLKKLDYYRNRDGRNDLLNNKNRYKESRSVNETVQRINKLAGLNEYTENDFHLKDGLLDALKQEYGIKKKFDGTFGVAYLTKYNTILKVTSDQREVDLAKRLLNKKLEHHADIFSVKKLTGYHGYNYWAIHLQYLSPLTPEETEIFKVVHYLEDYFSPDGMWTKRFIGKSREEVLDWLRNDNEGWSPGLTTELKYHPDNKKVLEMYNGYEAIQNELKKYKVTDIHCKNVGRKPNGTIAAFDLRKN